MVVSFYVHGYWDGMQEGSQVKSKKSIMGLGALMAGLALAASLASAPAASAAPEDECDLQGTLCGEIYNPPYGGIAFGIIKNWGEDYTRLLHPGEHSSPQWADTDGFYVGPGACARLGTWVPNDAGEGYWVDTFYNGPQSVKVHNHPYEHHVTAWNHPC